jgi:hypothetical protein
LFAKNVTSGYISPVLRAERIVCRRQIIPSVGLAV